MCSLNAFGRSTRLLSKLVDVNKISLQVLAKQEKLVKPEEAHHARLTIIETAMRHRGGMDLAEAVLKDETENYTYGKVTLNDYISAVNVLDNNRFSLLNHEVSLQRLLIEWRRLTDRLVGLEEVRDGHERYFN